MINQKKTKLKYNQEEASRKKNHNKLLLRILVHLSPPPPSPPKGLQLVNRRLTFKGNLRVSNLNRCYQAKRKALTVWKRVGSHPKCRFMFLRKNLVVEERPSPNPKRHRRMTLLMMKALMTKTVMKETLVRMRRIPARTVTSLIRIIISPKKKSKKYSKKDSQTLI